VIEPGISLGDQRLEFLVAERYNKGFITRKAHPRRTFVAISRSQSASVGDRFGNTDLAVHGKTVSSASSNDKTGGTG